MATQAGSRPDAYEQTSSGLRELLQRFKTATTREEFLWIADEAEQRGVCSDLEPAIETAYGVLATLAHKRLAAFASREPPTMNGQT